MEARAQWPQAAKFSVGLSRLSVGAGHIQLLRMLQQGHSLLLLPFLLSCSLLPQTLLPGHPWSRLSLSLTPHVRDAPDAGL